MIYGSDGRIEAQATLGDGIEHVFATTSGEVWVGYRNAGQCFGLQVGGEGLCWEGC
ncbi:hypothetical protein [Micromonospora chersina]|uniref:hypothetical protein n=1 Tax=Micromonospora chersina TaxID=47854 RepID=UPI0036931A14